MKKHILTFLFFSITCSAGFEPITVVRPNTITTNTDVMLGFDPLQYPCLRPLPNFLGQTHLLEMDESNNINFTITAWGTDPCLNIPLDNPLYEFFNLGKFPEGVYHIQLIWVDTSTPLPVPNGVGFVLIGENITFEVMAPTPTVIPSLNFYSLLFLGVLIMLVSLFYLKKNNKHVFSTMFILVFFSTSVIAKTFHISMSNTNGLPSAEDVVNQAATSPSPPVWILGSFNINSPLSVDYLVKKRATGNLLNLINQHPNWSLAKLYNILIVEYNDSVDETEILTNFQNDISISKSSFVDNIEYQFNPPILLNKNTTNKKKGLSSNKGTETSFLTDLNINSAWELSEGMGYIGAIDVGLQYDHNDLKTFDLVGNFLSGNILDGHYQIDFGSNDINVDEQEPFDITGIPSFEPCDLQDGVDDNLATSIFVGHGTHITGIIASKNTGIGGICKNCGISMMKISKINTTPTHCAMYNGQYTLIPEFPADGSINSMRTLGQLGVGTANWSGGVPITIDDFCESDVSGSCYALDFLKEQNVMMVASAGNHRTKLQFPAGEVGTIAVGGLDAMGNYWNESPNDNDPKNIIYTDFSDPNGCPRTGNNECGSNYSHDPINQKLDVMTQAKSVYSTFYENGEWADDLNCTDFQDGSVDGYGNCTGTSMSSPQVAGIIQLMRSAHPLLPNGTYDPNKTDGLINILNTSASRSTSGIGVSNYYGYGIPDASLALEKILGKSNGIQIKTRLTPMFVDVSTGAHDNHLYTPFPQLAMAFLILDELYIPDVSVPVVNEFTDFWYDHVSLPTLSFPSPRAEFYVFTTNNNPFTGTKNMVPLRRMDKTVTGNRNDTYAVSDAEIQTFHDNGYNYDGIEGYILPTCTPMPSCAPTGAISLYRDESESMNHRLVPTNVAPPNSTLLGFVYLNVDTDNDGLIDGQEIILGTNINVQDSDGDTIPDNVEYPPAGVPYSDPLISDIIFKHGFE